jgi:hypothetical protein
MREAARPRISLTLIRATNCGLKPRSSSRAEAGGRVAPAGPAVRIGGAGGPFRTFRSGFRPANARNKVACAGRAVGVPGTGRSIRCVRCRGTFGPGARAALTGDRVADARVTFAVAPAGRAIRRACGCAARAQAGRNIADAGAAIGACGASCPVRRLRPCRADIRDADAHNGEGSHEPRHMQRPIQITGLQAAGTRR